MISLGGLVNQKAFGKFEMGKVISNPFATAFIKEAEESQDHEVSMANNSLDTIIKMATELKAKMGENEKDIPAWIQDHITNAENYISQAASNYHEYGTNESINEETILVRRVDGKAVETFLKKYPKVKQIMTTLVQKNTDLMRGYKAFLKFKDKQEPYLGGRGEQTSSATFGSKVFYKYDFGAVKGGWPELYQYIYTLKYGGLDGAKVESIKEASPCWKGYKQVGMKDKGGKQVPNCVPVSETIEEAGLYGGVPKMYVKYMAVQKKVKELEDKQKALAAKYFAEKELNKKEKMLVDLKKGTATLAGYRKNLADIEEKYINNLYKDAEYTGEE